MHKHTVAIVGASGYAGLELTRILARHPPAASPPSSPTAGPASPPATACRCRPGSRRLAYRPLAEGQARRRGGLPRHAGRGLRRARAEAAREGRRVVDLSGAFRLLDTAAYPPWYGFDHPAPALLPRPATACRSWRATSSAGARLVTNPGCYATAIALAIAPLVRSGLVSPDGIAVTGISGVSGAGRKASEDYSFCETAEDLRAYRLGKHQHVPEIEQTVARYAGACGPISFTPVLVPIRRGILATATLRLAGGLAVRRPARRDARRLRGRAVREAAARPTR